MILRDSCKVHAFRSMNREITNQEEEEEHCLYAGVLHPVGTDSFMEMDALNFLHKYRVTHNNRLLSRFRC